MSKLVITYENGSISICRDDDIPETWEIDKNFSCYIAKPPNEGMLISIVADTDDMEVGISIPLMYKDYNGKFADMIYRPVQIENRPPKARYINGKLVITDKGDYDDLEDYEGLIEIVD